MALSNSNVCRLIGGVFRSITTTSWLSPLARTNQLQTACVHNKHENHSVLEVIHKRGLPYRKPRSQDKSPISGNSFYKGIVLKTVIRHPKKPNSGNRKCAIVKLSTGKEVCAYIPGEGHNLQEHSQVMVIGGRRRDLIGVKANIVRGKLDCAPVRANKA